MEEHGRHCKSWKYIIGNAFVYHDVYRSSSELLNETSDCIFVSEQILEEAKIFHGIVPTISCPELKVVEASGRCDQGVAQIDTMTPGVLSQKHPGSLADLGIDGDRLNCGKERLKNSVLLQTSQMPKLCNGHGRAEEHRGSLTQGVPLVENAGVTSARDLEQNI